MQNTQGKGGGGFSAAAVAAVAAAQTISLAPSYPMLLWKKVCVVCIRVWVYNVVQPAVVHMCIAL